MPPPGRVVLRLKGRGGCLPQAEGGVGPTKILESGYPESILFTHVRPYFGPSSAACEIDHQSSPVCQSRLSRL